MSQSLALRIEAANGDFGPPAKQELPR
jgi:hypothetical protein